MYLGLYLSTIFGLSCMFLPETKGSSFIHRILSFIKTRVWSEGYLTIISYILCYPAEAPLFVRNSYDVVASGQTTYYDLRDNVYNFG